MNRRAWKVYWRMLRIYNREQRKAWQDTLIFGTGFLLTTSDGYQNHVLPWSVLAQEMVNGPEAP